jgi:hypothetical protein
MKKKESLFASGPFANDTTAYQKFLVDSVATSTAIEIGTVPKRLMAALKRHSRRPQDISLRFSPSKGF